MSWVQDWVNVFKDTVIHDAKLDYLLIWRQVHFSGDRTVRIEESAHGGAVIADSLSEPLSPAEAITEPPDPTTVMHMAAYGNPKVYLAIKQDQQRRRFLSGPVHTTLELKGVEWLALAVLAPLPRTLGLKRYRYRVGINGHCIFSVKDTTKYEIDGQRQGPDSAPWG